MSTVSPADDALAAVRRHYPDALPTGVAVDRLLSLLHARYALAPGDVLLADSVCADDVNSMEYPASAAAMRGPFKLGGLDGFPFVGVTGMGAYAAHVPAHGAFFIYHAPHIGVSRSGVLGEIQRVGQTAPSGCCGAARAALAKLRAGAIVPGDITELDYQQNVLEQVLLAEQARILAADDPLKEATEVMQSAISTRVDALIARTRFNGRYLIVMGAVLINGDHDMGSYTTLRRLVATDLATGLQTDLADAYRAL
ncbi:MAG: hypothetical protein MUF00_17040 [Gemmatimonadaceae bacterium]|nr:hypothetical protein [Gemmatimonadaceae bacterium]